MDSSGRRSCAVLEATIAAQERALVSAQRAFYLPSFSLNGDATKHFSRAGAGSELDAVGGDANWSVGVNASFPLYRGGAKFAASREAEEELAGLRGAARRGGRARRTAHSLSAAPRRRRVRRHRPVRGWCLAAHKNLDLVEDAYGRGVVSILDLLDAQTAAFVAEEGAANAVYDFLLQLMEVERSIGKFYFFASEERRETWFARADAYFAAARN